MLVILVLILNECYFILSSVVVKYLVVLKFWLNFCDLSIFVSNFFGIGLFVL